MQFTEKHRNVLNDLINAFEWIKDEAHHVVPDYGNDLIERGRTAIEAFDLAED